MKPIDFAKFLLLLADLALAAGSAQAATISFQEGVSPTGTYNHGATYIRSGNPDDNQDGDPDLEMIVGPTTGDVIRGLLEFDVSAIPSGNQIDSASLVLTTHATSVGIGGTP